MSYRQVMRLALPLLLAAALLMPAVAGLLVDEGDAMNGPSVQVQQGVSQITIAP